MAIILLLLLLKALQLRGSFGLLNEFCMAVINHFKVIGEHASVLVPRCVVFYYQHHILF